MSSDDTDALLWNTDRLRTASYAAGVALWSWNVDTNDINMYEHAYALWGVPRDGPLTFEKLSMHIYLPDRVKVQLSIEATRTKPGPYEVDFRARRDDQTVWVGARGLGADEGIVRRVMFGLFLDVTARKGVEYGSLSAADGPLDVSCTEQNGDIAVVWTERGGPAVSTPIRAGRVWQQAYIPKYCSPARWVNGIRLAGSRSGDHASDEQGATGRVSLTLSSEVRSLPRQTLLGSNGIGSRTNRL